jgi:hypothetical protein
MKEPLIELRLLVTFDKNRAFSGEEVSLELGESIMKGTDSGVVLGT